jgi:hypothetical protein
MDCLVELRVTIEVDGVQSQDEAELRVMELFADRSIVLHECTAWSPASSLLYEDRKEYNEQHGR